MLVRCYCTVSSWRSRECLKQAQALLACGFSSTISPSSLQFQPAASRASDCSPQGSDGGLLIARPVPSKTTPGEPTSTGNIGAVPNAIYGCMMSLRLYLRTNLTILISNILTSNIYYLTVFGSQSSSRRAFTKLLHFALPSLARFRTSRSNQRPRVGTHTRRTIGGAAPLATKPLGCSLARWG